jgi:hypothetical protein
MRFKNAGFAVRAGASWQSLARKGGKEHQNTLQFGFAGTGHRED